jgi:hypothetical protein
MATFPSEESQQLVVSELNYMKGDGRPVVIASGIRERNRRLVLGRAAFLQGTLTSRSRTAICIIYSRIRCPAFGDICCDDLGTSQGFCCTAESKDVVANLADEDVNRCPLELRPR